MKNNDFIWTQSGASVLHLLRSDVLVDKIKMLNDYNLSNNQLLQICYRKTNVEANCRKKAILSDWCPFNRHCCVM